MTTQTKTNEQQNIVIKIRSEIIKKLPKSVRETLVEQYRKLFTGFAMTKRAKKHSWGRSWHNALGLSFAIIIIAKKIHSPNNPAIQYLESVHSAYKKHWSKIIMTHPERDTESQKDDKETTAMHDNGMRMINDATNELMKIIAQYNEKTKEQIIEHTTEQTNKTVQTAQQNKAPAKASPMPTPAISTIKTKASAEKVTQPNTQVAQQPTIALSQKQHITAQEKPMVVPAAAPVKTIDKKQIPRAIPVATVAPQTTKLSRTEHIIPKLEQTAQKTVNAPAQKLQPLQQKSADTKQQIVPLNTKINQQQFKLFLFKKFNQRTA
jgi:hypothetical protein